MRQEEILEYNKRCAEFLGGENHPCLVPYTPEPDDMWFDAIKNSNLQNPNGGSMWKLHELKFHSDWNWIMEVLDKIAKLDYGWKVTSKYVNIYSHSGDPRGEFDCTHQINCPKDVKLDAVRTINQFLIWYEIQTNK